MEPASKSRARFIEHAGKPILLMDFDTDDVEEFLAAIDESRAIITKQPPESVLTLVWAGRARFDPRVVEALKKLVADNRPYVKAGAVAGMNALQRIVYRLVMQFTGRKNLRTFETLEEAKAWLAIQ